MATMTVNEFATKIEANPRDVRKFLRSITPADAQPGKGGRWSIEGRDVRSLTKKFREWDDARRATIEDASEEEVPTDAEVTTE